MENQQIVDQTETEIQKIFQLTLRIAARPRRAFAGIRALQSIARAAQTEHGFLASRVYQETENPEVLCLVEDWSGEPALKSHMRSSCFTDLLRLMETAPEAPVLEVRAVCEVHGLDYVEAVRGDS
jgi:quinol monooxygenase YgiN